MIFRKFHQKNAKPSKIIEIDNNNNKTPRLQSGIFNFFREKKYVLNRKKSTHQHFNDFSNINAVFFFCYCWKENGFE